jgi:hypothetical protein
MDISYRGLVGADVGTDMKTGFQSLSSDAVVKLGHYHLRNEGIQFSGRNPVENGNIM